MKTKRRLSFLAAATAIIMMLVACGQGTSPATDGGGTSTDGGGATSTSDAGGTDGGSSGGMTEVGTPRSETLIVDMTAGRATTPDLFNFYVPGVTSNNTLNPWLRQHLWEVNTITGEIYGELADGMPIPLNDEFTEFDIKIREGLKWHDGVDFTAHDVVFTGTMLLENEGLTRHAQFSSMVEEIYAKDDYTVYIKTHNPEPKLETRLGVVVHSNFFMPIPKHIWENEDPLTFKFSEPISVSAYKLKEYDPQGYWFLYEKRDDWENSLEGQIVGKEPIPNYILQRAYGTEEKRVMASISHDLDVIAGIGPESWELLKDKNEYASIWYDGFPYAIFDDPCARGILLNYDLEPFNDMNVRWALALTVDIVNASINGYDGLQKFNAIQVPPTGLLSEVYHKPMRQWLTDYALDDGYQPFNPNTAFELVEELQKQGIDGLPEGEEAIIDTFGVGWWKYDPDKATELLQASGFTLQDGKWYLPNGDLWTIELKTIKEGEIQHIRTAFSTGEAWRKFGIDVNVIQEETAVFSTSQSTGDYQAIGAWPCCGCIPDISTNIETWRADYYVPIGEVANANYGRWQNQEATDLMNELLSMPREDPQMVPKTQELLKIFVEELPYMPMYGSTFFTPVDTYYWEGFPSSSDPYAGPWSWWAQMKYIVPNMEPTGR